MNRAAARLLAAIGFGVVASQAGHLLVYQLEFGQSAWAVQSQGAHAYFPLLAKTGFGLAAVVLLASLLLIGVSRMVSASPARRVAASPNYFQLVSLLFTIQMTCFVLQETLESLAAGATPESAMKLILIGAVGQLPAAVVAAIVLKWLATRFETALIVLRNSIIAIEAQIVTVRVAQSRLEAAFQPALAEVCPTVYVKRGPPSNLRG